MNNLYFNGILQYCNLFIHAHHLLRPIHIKDDNDNYKVLIHSKVIMIATQRNNYWNHFQNVFFQLMNDKKYWQPIRMHQTLKSLSI